MKALAVILICSFGTAPDDCTKQTAQDILYYSVPLAECGMAAQSIVAQQAGDRANNSFVKVYCRQ